MPRAAVLLVALLLAGSGGLAAQTLPASAEPVPLDEPLGLDPAVRTGVLPNGLTYFVRRNTEPRNRAELRLAVDAGSVLEEEDQRGLAHLLEHMAFSGTERFPEQELVRFLERTGMRFGPDVNAYTSFDETVYLLQLPTDDAELFATGLEVLREWAGAITLDPDAIDRERGVVLEEWRVGRGAGARIQDQQVPVLFGDSRYAERLPIGDPEVIRRAPPERLRAFYETWYRPDLMAVVAVGDFDPEEVAARIRTLFADLPARPGAPPRPTFDVPAPAGTRFAIATDPEQTATVVELLHFVPARRLETVGDYRAALVDQLYVQLLNARLRELTRRPGAPFLAGLAFQGGFVRPVDAYGLAAVAPEGGVPRALEALLMEAARIRAHGFTETEFARARADLLRAYEQAYRERETTPSRVFADALVRLFLEGEAEPGIEREFALVRQLLPTIAREEVEARAEAVLGEGHRVVLVAAPETEPPPTEAELRAVLQAVAAVEPEPYEDAVPEGPLVAEPPQPGTIVAVRVFDDLEVTEWTLSNGARVVLRPTDFRADEVLLTAFRPGGLSVYPDSLARAGRFAAAAVTVSGVGDFSATDLERVLAGRAVAVGPYIGEHEQGVTGRASPDDLDVLFQLVHLHLTAPRRDPEAFAAYQERTATALRTRQASPVAAFQDAITAALTQDHPRTRPATPEEVLALDLDDLLALYTERFRTASDLTLVLVGAFEPQTVAPLVERYVASLPTDPAAAERPRARGIGPPDGPTEVTVRRGLEPQARVQLVFHGLLRYQAEDAHAEARRERFLLSALAEALAIRLREELREERGGVYGVGVNATTNRVEGTYQVAIGFATDPERVDELVAAALAEVRAFQTEGPDADVLARVLEAGRRGEETGLRQNATWRAALATAWRHGERPEQVLFREDLRAQITPETLRAMAAYLDPERLVRVVLLPQDDLPAGPGG